MNYDHISPFKAPRRGSNTKFVPRRLFKRSVPPELPATPYMRFGKNNMEKIKEYYPEGKEWNLGRIMGRIWRELPEREKDPYYESYNGDKMEYDKRLKAYYSNQHRANIPGSLDMIEQDSSVTGFSLLMTNDDALIDPAEDEYDYTYNWDTDKQKALARFIRNNRLMKAILSESKMPQIELQTVQYLNDRFESLKKSSSTLDAYLKRLTSEVQHIESVYEQRLNSIRQSNIQFQEKLREITLQKSSTVGPSANTSSLYCLDSNKLFVRTLP